jgi:hypothetical protein
MPSILQGHPFGYRLLQNAQMLIVNECGGYSSTRWYHANKVQRSRKAKITKEKKRACDVRWREKELKYACPKRKPMNMRAAARVMFEIIWHTALVLRPNIFSAHAAVEGFAAERHLRPSVSVSEYVYARRPLG